MRSAQYLLAASLVFGVPAAALAQTPPPPPMPSAPSYGAWTEDHWLASGFVGSSFNQSGDNPNVLDDSSVTFGGQLAYLWAGIIGAEFLADFAPTFKATTLALADDPSLNTYMANLITAVPLGGEHRIQPYFSGGVGGVQIATDVLNVPLNPASGTTVASHTRFGADVGGGLLAFAGAFGFRGDVRYFWTGSENATASSAAEQVASNLLSGLSFWRANVGVAFRW